MNINSPDEHHGSRLASPDGPRRETLLARAGHTPSGAYRFDIRDIRPQGDEETVFLDFR